RLLFGLQLLPLLLDGSPAFGGFQRRSQSVVQDVEALDGGIDAKLFAQLPRLQRGVAIGQPAQCTMQLEVSQEASETVLVLERFSQLLRSAHGLVDVPDEQPPEEHERERENENEECKSVGIPQTVHAAFSANGVALSGAVGGGCERGAGRP